VGVKNGYKQTDVGAIPVDWDVVLLDSVAKRGSGHTPDKAHPEYWGGTIKWVSLRDSDRLDRLYIWDTAAKITPAGIANSSATMHPRGTVVLSRDAGVGKAAIMKDDMAVSQHFMAWTCGPSLNNHFLYYWLHYRKSEFERIAMGNTIKTIGLPYFRRLVVPLPTKAEQATIAEALSDADAIIESLEQLLTKKRQIKQGAMQELLTRRKRLPGFSGEWELKRLGQISKSSSGGTPPTSVAAYYDGEIPWVSISDMTKGGKVIRATEQNLTIAGLTSSAAHMFPPGTVLYAMYASIGECSVAGVPLCSSQAILGIRPNDTLSSEFLYYFLTSLRSVVKAMGQQGTQANLNAGIVRRFEIRLPPLQEQTAIAAILSDMDAELAVLEAKLAKARQLKLGMMQELLTGRIRLI
jgi:type I restriction enzyme, S subunit